MTPREKAEELFLKMYNTEDPMGNYPMCFDTAKQCALIAVDEIINTLTDVMWIKDEHTDFAVKTKYWYEVKTEINAL